LISNPHPKKPAPESPNRNTAGAPDPQGGRQASRQGSRRRPGSRQWRGGGGGWAGGCSGSRRGAGHAG